MSNNSKPEISMILPSIRVNKIAELYDSLCKSTKRTFELIIVSPYPVDSFILQNKNIKYIRDFGSPVRAQNIALMHAEGKYLTWWADDVILLPGMIDKHIDLLISMGPDFKNVVIAKYQEGQENSDDRKKIHHDDYFKIRAGPAASPYFDPEWWLFNVAFMHTTLAEALGGWNCEYEATWVSHTDMAVRAQACGANVRMSGESIMVVDHMPGITGDHAPIHYAQEEHDVPLFNQKYYQPDWHQKLPMQLDIMNWKKSPAIWNRRFQQEEK